MTLSAASIPCTVVTGALGSGKTTLIRSLLEQPGMDGTALIVNEFGEVGLDHLILSSAVETTLLMDNGCLCCSLRGDVVDTILDLFASVERGDIPPFNRILIETTGLADPIPIVHDLASPALREKVHLCRVVACVDGLVGLAEVRSNPIAIDQVAQSDLCLITKTDSAEPLQVDMLAEALIAINPMARVIQVGTQRVVGPEILFGEYNSLPTASFGKKEHVISGSLETTHHHGHDHNHAPSPHEGVASWSTVVSRPLLWPVVRDWIDLVYSLHAANILRAKGVFWVEERSLPILFQAVGPIISAPTTLPGWEDARKESRLVFITKNFDPLILRQSFEYTVLEGSI